MFHKKKKLDERELMEMYKVEHYGFWFVFWALCISIFVQFIFLERPFAQISSEFIIFMLMAVLSLIGYLKGGHYDYYTEPGWKSYLLYSGIAAVVFTIIQAVLYYTKHYFQKSLGAGLMGLLIFGVCIFGLCYAVLAIMGEFIKKRRAKLAKKYEEDDDN